MARRHAAGILLVLFAAALGMAPPSQVQAASTNLPAPPTSLSLASPTGQTLPARVWTRQHRMILRFDVQATSSSVTPEVEVQRWKVPFTGHPTLSGTPMTTSGTASITVLNLPDGRYHWQARATSSTGSSSWVSYESGNIAFRVATHPPRVTWVGSHAGAFSPSGRPVSVHFRLNRDGHVRVSVYRVGGTSPVRTVTFNHVHAHQVKTVFWNGKTAQGKPVAHGKYFFALRAADLANNLTHSNFGLFTYAVPVVARPSTPNTSVAGKHIVIALSRQALYAYDGSHLVLQTLVTTGNPSLPTPIGYYSIMAKLSPFEFISPWPPGSPYYYAPSWTQHAMLFRAGGYYIHDAPWRSVFGPGTNGPGQPGTNYGGTHGCVNVPAATMDALWNWTPIGTPVEVVP